MLVPFPQRGGMSQQLYQPFGTFKIKGIEIININSIGNWTESTREWEINHELCKGY